MSKFEKNVNRVYTLGGLVLLITVIMAMSSCGTSNHCQFSKSNYVKTYNMCPAYH